MRKSKKGMSPLQILPIGFLCIILIGAFLLMLPIASVDHQSLPFSSALFTATSATCVTGLVVVDTGTHFTLFGQIVILLLIQMGGLGFMTVSTILFSFTRRKISMRDRLTIAESLGENHLQGVVRLGRTAVLVTGVCEGVGAVLLSIRFIPIYGLLRGVWYGIFHSVSAFCNAGFDLIGDFASFTAYTGDALVNLTLMALIVAGGLGFSVILNMFRAKRFKYFRMHTKIVVSWTIGLILVGALLIICMEYDNPQTLGKMPFFEKLLAGTFQSVTLRTAGFNTIDQLAQRDATKALGIVLMLFGGAPAGTAGGLKITTFVTLLTTMHAYVRGRRDTVIFGRTVASEQVRRALTVFLIGNMFLLGCTMAVSILEHGHAAGGYGILNQMYETTSALCTVGVSVGVTAVTGMASRMILCAMMFVGRVGLLTLALSLTEGMKTDAFMHYPQEDIMIG